MAERIYSRLQPTFSLLDGEFIRRHRAALGNLCKAEFERKENVNEGELWTDADEN